MCTKMVSSTSAGFFSNEKIGESSLESPHCDRENLCPKLLHMNPFSAN